MLQSEGVAPLLVLNSSAAGRQWQRWWRWGGELAVPGCQAVQWGGAAKLRYLASAAKRWTPQRTTFRSSRTRAGRPAAAHGRKRLRAH